MRRLAREFAKRAFTLVARVRYAHLHGVEWGRGVVVKGMPILDVRDGGRISLGDRAVLNSRNRGYHLGMYGPVKLMVDRPGASITIGAESRIHGSCLHAYSAISIGRRCLIAANCQIIDGSGHDLAFDDVERRIHTTGTSHPIVIEDAVWIGANTIVLPGVRIGRGSVVGAGSVVTHDIPAGVVAAGNPARVIRSGEG